MKQALPVEDKTKPLGQRGFKFLVMICRGEGGGGGGGAFTVIAGAALDKGVLRLVTAII